MRAVEPRQIDLLATKPGQKRRGDADNQLFMRYDQYLTFSIGDDVYALDVAASREVIEIVSLTPMPKAPDWIRGMLNLRGSVIPVLDLKRKFGMGETRLGESSLVIVLELAFDAGRFVLGVLVDAALEVFEYAVNEIEPPPKFGARYSRSYLRGLGRRNGRVFVILEADKVFADTDSLILDDEAVPAPPPSDAQKSDYAHR